MKIQVFLFCLLFASAGSGQTIIKKDTLGKSTVTLHTSVFGASDSSITFLNLHENEQASVMAAKEVLAKHALFSLTELKARHTRFLQFSYKGRDYAVDPNRIFTTQGAEATLHKNSHYLSEEHFKEALLQVRQFAQNLTESFVDNKRMVVALHNNTEGEPLSIISYKSGDQQKNTAAVHMNLRHDPDDFFLTTEKRFYRFLKAKGFNVVLQDNDNVEDDGSLSVYAGKKKIPYINIEAQINHQAEQEEMIEAVLLLVKTQVSESGD